ncbi:MAG TPA: ArsA-related P-loop ATPase [Acidimicrobiales bacterium]|nr:ArsA-related P-loop ATPase [Acidimicrobiales bacterium]
MSTSPAAEALSRLVVERSVLVCCGSGGVGKTTTAAALALHAAQRGSRACVVTIDPARRLADALGASGVANTPHRIDGPWPGELSAVMLDAKGTFDDLVRRYAVDDSQSERILTNRLYQNLVTALSGTQEYMATEKLFELHESGAFDVVVVDTPPTRSALDFLDAPTRLAGFLDNRIFRLLLTPGRAYLRAMSVATQMLLRTIGKVAGSEIVEDAVAFFQAFEGMEQGFRERASRVEGLLAAGGTGFVVVTSARRDSIEEAMFFAGKLSGSGRTLDAVVVNRLHPDFGPPIDASSAHATAPRRSGAACSGAETSWAALVANLDDMAAVVERERDLVHALELAVDPAPVVRVPVLEDDVHDLDGLEEVVRHLVGGGLPWASGRHRDRQ